MATIDTMRWILLGSISIYAIPLLIYLALFRKIHILWEIVLGAFSFLFYGPTYLNILNIYSICRIDDISWGTKGLVGNVTGNWQLKNSWKLTKYFHVTKYLLWNVVISAILLSFGSEYTSEFIITIIAVVLMGFSLSIKILLAVIYMVSYKLKTCRIYETTERRPRREMSKLQHILSHYRDDIFADIKCHLNAIKNEYYSDSMRN